MCRRSPLVATPPTPFLGLRLFGRKLPRNRVSDRRLVSHFFQPFKGTGAFPLYFHSIGGFPQRMPAGIERAPIGLGTLLPVGLSRSGGAGWRDSNGNRKRTAHYRSSAIGRRIRRSIAENLGDGTEPEAS